MKRIKRVPIHLIQKYKTYTTAELSKLLKAHPQTLRRWYKRGLPAIKDSTPLLFSGANIKRYLSDIKKENKTKLKNNEHYCPKCKKATKAKDLKYIESRILNKNNVQIIIRGTCSICGTKLSRFSSSNQLKKVV